MNLSFRFQGIKTPTRDPACVLCAAVAAKMCLVRKTDPGHREATPTDVGCGLCAAIKNGYCDAHGRGAKFALDAHKPAEDEAATWGLVRKLVDAELAKIADDRLVRIDVVVYDAYDPKAPRGDFPRQLRIEVLQLDHKDRVEALSA
jgi:hypothetical protein